jgi:hypothetical protein
VAEHLFAIAGRIWIQRQRCRHAPDVFTCWRPHQSVQLLVPEAVLLFAAGGPLSSAELEDLRQWLQPEAAETPLA